MHAPLVFGVFPLGVAGAPGGVATGPPDDVAEIGRALGELQGDGPDLLPRMYVNWAGRADTTRCLDTVGLFADADGPAWDMVLCYRDPAGDVGAWCEFVAQVVDRYGHELAAVQVTGEPNLRNVGGAADGDYARARQALIQGVIRAAAVKRERGATAAIGFAAVPDWYGRTDFWTSIRKEGGAEFARGLDYAGIDLYPDVFGPRFAPDRIGWATTTLLTGFREQALEVAGIGPDTPIRICENGWPTGPDRSEQTQAEVLERIVRAVAASRAELNVTHWELFTLRDADSRKDDLFHRFGVLHDDYSPKPAFPMLVDLVREFGPAAAPPPPPDARR